MDRKISRRTFLKLAGTSALVVALPTFLEGCTPLTNAQEQALKTSELTEFNTFYKYANDLVNKFGHAAIDGSVPVVRNVFEECDRSVKQPGTEPVIFKRTEWGKNSDNFLTAAQEHLEQVTFNNITTIPDPKNESYVPEGYIAPDINLIRSNLTALCTVFPALSLVINRVNISCWTGGGLQNGDWINTPTPVNNAEIFFFSAIHESVHGLHDNFIALKDYISLANFSFIPEKLMESTHVIVSQYCETSDDEESIRSYGLMVEPYVANDARYTESNKTNAIKDDRYLEVFSLVDGLPESIRIVQGETEDQQIYKRNLQHNWILKSVMTSLYRKESRFDNNSEMSTARDEIVKSIIAEIQHYLVGPFQDSNHGASLLSNYENLETRGILGPNLEQQKAMFTFLVNPEIGGNPNNIRTALGLPNLIVEKQQEASDILTQCGIELMGQEDRYNQLYKYYKLPDSESRAFYLIQNTNVLYESGLLGIRLADNKVKSIEDLKMLYFRNDYPVEYEVRQPVHELDFIEEIKTYESSKNQIASGEIVTDKIINPESGLPTPTNFLWVKKDGKIHLYKKSDSTLSAVKMLYETRGKRNYYSNLYAIVSNGEIFETLEEFLPNLTPENREMRIVDIRTLLGNKVLIGDTDEARNGVFEVELDWGDRDKLVKFVSNYSSVVPVLLFNINSSDSQDPLDIQLYVVNPLRDTSVTVAIKSIKIIKAGANMN